MDKNKEKITKRDIANIIIQISKEKNRVIDNTNVRHNETQSVTKNRLLHWPLCVTPPLV